MAESGWGQGDFDRQARVMLLSMLAGVIAVLATGGAWLLTAMIRLFTNLFFFQHFDLVVRTPASHTLGAWVIALPVVGGVLVGLIARYGTDKIRGHGIPEAIEAILFSRSKMTAKVAVLKPLSSAIAIGSGGPFGAEGPIIMTGGAIGSLLAQYVELSAAERKALLVAGAAAGMTAIFGTPLAAVLLAIELLLFELRPRSFLPVAVACAVAGFVRPLVMEPGHLFALQLPDIPEGDTLWMAWWCGVAGVLCGVLATGLSRALYLIEDLFNLLPVHWMWWPALAGVAVGVGGDVAPRTLGVGYDVIHALLQPGAPGIPLGDVAVIVLVKAVIWLIALGSLTSGGVLAPVLTIGAGCGALLAQAMPQALPGAQAAAWPLLCMAGVLGGVMHAPLTAALFAMEVTGDTNHLLPLLATTTAAYGCTVLLMRRSILTEKIARRGRHIWREIGVDPLERQFVDDCMTRDVVCIDADTSIRDALHQYFGPDHGHRAYPVVAQGQLLGMVEKSTLLPWPSDAACRMACAPPDVALSHETCRTVAARLARLGAERLPVVHDLTGLRVVGIISRSDLVKPMLSHFHDEEVKERPRKLPWGRAG